MITHNTLINVLTNNQIISKFCNAIYLVIGDLDIKGKIICPSKFDRFFLTNKHINEFSFSILEEYFKSIAEIIEIEKSTVIIAFIYVDRLCNSYTKIFKRENLKKYFFKIELFLHQ